MARCRACWRRVPPGGVCPKDGGLAADPPPSSPAPPASPGMTIGECLGIGGAGVVWAVARDGEAAALKVAHHADERTRARFRREAEALARIGPPAVPAFHADGLTEDGRPYLVMERLYGRTVAQELEAMAVPPAPGWVREVAGAVLVALARVHEAGFVHCDIKPENVFVSGSAELVATITDLGLARRGEPSEAGAGTVIYMAPEQLEGKPVSPATDLYAVGVLLHELLTLRPPYMGERAEIEHGHLALRPPRLPVGDALADLVARCLEKDPARRPVSASALRRELEAAFRDLAQPVAVPAATRSLLAEGPQPVALLAVDVAEGDPSRVAELVTAQGGCMARQHGTLAVCAFLPGPGRDPLRAALDAAAEVVTNEFAVAVHVAPVNVRRRSSPTPSFYGRAVERPDEWAPRGAWRGVFVTADAARDLPEGQGVARTERPCPLVGREAELAAAAETFAAAVAHREPTLFWVTGEPGTGKSRLAAALAELAPPPAGWVVDDAHEAPDEALDAIERALVTGADALWIAVLATPRLALRRPRFGERARVVRRLDLGPLPLAASRTLAAHLLAPAEYPPIEILDRLAAWTAGHPGQLVRVVRTLKREGLVRRRERAAGWYVATTVLEQLPPAASAQWLATQELGHLVPALASFARIVAALGGEVTVPEVDAVQLGLERSGGASSPVAAAYGLPELARRKLLVTVDDRYGFREPALREALERTTADQDRRAVHRAALDHWLARRDAPTEVRLLAEARHAAGCGETLVAAAAELALGDHALRAHNPVAADAHYTLALAAYGAEGAASRLAALAGRARARYRVHRLAEAAADVREARALAAAPDVAADLLLLEAMILDWAHEDHRSAQCAAEAEQLAPGATGALLGRLLLARGRTLWRSARVPEAIEPLERARALARDAGDVETEIVSLLLLAPGLVAVIRLDDAERCFEELLAVCEAADDRLHLGVAHGNRSFLWMARGRTDLAVADLTRAAQLAQEAGNPGTELDATLGLANAMYWSGDYAAALVHTERARDLERRFLDRPAAISGVLHARVLAALGRDDEARSVLASLDAYQPDEIDPSTRILRDAVAVALGRPGDWHRLLDAALASMPEVVDVLDVLFWCLRAADATCRERAAGLVAERLPSWPASRARFEPS